MGWLAISTTCVVLSLLVPPSLGGVKCGPKLMDKLDELKSNCLSLIIDYEITTADTEHLKKKMTRCCHSECPPRDLVIVACADYFF